MAIVKMKRLRLLAPKSQREEILRELLLLGCVEISNPEPPGEDDELAGVLTREAAGVFERRGEYELLLRAIELLDRYDPKKKGLLEARPIIERDAVLNESALSGSLEVAEKIDSCENSIREVDSETGRIKALAESLEPWRAMDVPLDMAETQTCFLTTGMLPSSFDLTDVRKAVSDAGCEGEIYEISSDKDMHYVLIVAMKDKRVELSEALRPFSFAQSSLAGLSGTPKENITRIESELLELDKRKGALIEEIRSFSNRRDELKLSSDCMMTKLETAENAERLMYTRSALTFEGWVPVDAEAQMGEALAKYDCAWETRDPTEDEIPKVPIKLKSNAFTRPFSMVTEMYSYPAYNGIDPNAHLAWSFTLFFGIMFADIGYGLIMLLAGLIIKYKVHARKTVGYMGGLAIICGISCMIFGAVSGAFFGDAITQISVLLGGPEVKLPFLIDPLSDPMTILIISLGIGFVHLMYAVGLSAYMLIRDGQWVDALCDCGTTYLMFIGIALMALGVTPYVLYAAVLVFIFAQGRASKSIGGKIGSGLWALYNFVTGWFGDILSYSRLMALMLAGGVIAQVFNMLGVMIGNIIGFIIVFLIGHALNFGLNIIGTYAHTSRLEYLEFFGKFYRDGGRGFEPLQMKTSYYDIAS